MTLTVRPVNGPLPMSLVRYSDKDADCPLAYGLRGEPYRNGPSDPPSWIS
jgi:hypothetical protein